MFTIKITDLTTDKNAIGASRLAQLFNNNPPAMQETWVQSLGWEHPLEEEMATHSSIPAWKIPWTEEPGGLQSMGLQKRHDLATDKQQEECYQMVCILQSLLRFYYFKFTCMLYFI